MKVNLGLVVISLILLNGCLPNNNRDRASEQLSQSSKDVQSFDSSLVFNDLTLEQADEQGKLLWKIKAKRALYDKDKKRATVENPQGEFYQDGKVVFKLSADRGDVIEDGKTITVKGKITLLDVRDGVEIKGQELEWKPALDVLEVRNQFSAKQKNLTLSALQGKFFSRAHKADVNGQIKVQIKDPQLAMQTEQLTWLTKAEQVTSDQPIKIQYVRANGVQDQASGNKSRVDLKAKTAVLENDAIVTVAQPSTLMKSNLLSWQLDTQIVTSPQALSVFSSQEQVTLTANQGELKIQEKIANLTGQVRGSSQRNQATVSSDQLTWFLESQTFEARGNINYAQVSPVFNLRGSNAKGRLQDQAVTVTGGESTNGQVVTEIVPNFAKQP